MEWKFNFENLFFDGKLFKHRLHSFILSRSLDTQIWSNLVSWHFLFLILRNVRCFNFCPDWIELFSTICTILLLKKKSESACKFHWIIQFAYLDSDFKKHQFNMNPYANSIFIANLIFIHFFQYVWICMYLLNAQQLNVNFCETTFKNIFILLQIFMFLIFHFNIFDSYSRERFTLNFN